MEILSLEELKAVQSLVGQLQAEFVRNGDGGTVARKKAATRVGATYVPVVTAEELESAIAKARARFYDNKRRANLQKYWDKKLESKKSVQIDPDRNSTYVKMYRQWCIERKYVANDILLAYFTGAAKNTFVYSRKKLESEGFVFTENGRGYDVEVPVQKRTYTEDEVRVMMQKLLDSIRGEGR